jgi:hypothetical protein
VVLHLGGERSPCHLELRLEHFARVLAGGVLVPQLALALLPRLALSTKLFRLAVRLSIPRAELYLQTRGLRLCRLDGVLQCRHHLVSLHKRRSRLLPHCSKPLLGGSRLLHRRQT